MGIAIVYADRRRLQERSAMTAIIHGTADPAYDTDALLPDDGWRPLPRDVAWEIRAENA
jgi:hypothetical protein